MKVKFNIVGMTCVNCSNAIERVTKKIDGVKDATVSFASSYGEFELENESVVLKVRQKIEKLGYEIATNYDELNQKKLEFLASMKQRLIISAILTAIVMVLHMFMKHSFLNSLIQLILTTIVVFYCGRNFFIHAYGSLKNRNFDMNVLVSLGVGCAYFYSAFVFFFPNLVDEKFSYVYFESAVMIVTFIMFGKFLEENSKLKANDYIKSLLDLTPKTAILVCPDGENKEILASELKLNDAVLVKSGMTIPGDGVIIQGGAEIDASVLTGESMPVYKKEGDFVNAGCINTNGVISIKITKEKHETLLARIAKLLSEANAKKMPISRVADRVANIFVPAVVLIALATFLVWWLVAGNPYYGVMCAISVLVISCPCALGLAVPISIVCALSNLAKNGVLVKNPEVIEILKNAKRVVFDKTGTLTKGKISAINTNLDKEIFTKVASLELLSHHPIAKGIVELAKKRGIPTYKFDENYEDIIGKGIKSGTLLVGNESLLRENGVDDIKEDEFESFLADGFGVILVAFDGKYRGYIVLSDELRSGAKELNEWLESQGIERIMLTGDNEKVAKFISSKLDIKDARFDMLPDDKFEVIKGFDKGEVSVFVGDGVNDALSLKEASVGIAMNSGSDIAKGAGDILLVNNALIGIKRSIKISDSSMKIIKQNLFWAFFYNIICIPVAAGVLYPSFGILLNPAYAAIAMSLSSVSVVLNSLRLKVMKV